MAESQRKKQQKKQTPAVRTTEEEEADEDEDEEEDEDPPSSKNQKQEPAGKFSKRKVAHPKPAVIYENLFFCFVFFLNVIVESFLCFPSNLDILLLRLLRVNEGMADPDGPTFALRDTNKVRRGRLVTGGRNEERRRKEKVPQRRNSLNPRSFPLRMPAFTAACLITLNWYKLPYF